MGRCCGCGKKGHFVDGSSGVQTSGKGRRNSISRAIWLQKVRQHNMTSNVHSVESKADFEKQLAEAGNKLVVVDFFAEWCGPCKQIAPQIDILANTMTDVVFLKVDVDQNEEIASDQGINCMPTFKLFLNGKMVESFEGANLDKIKDSIAKHKKN